MVDMAYGTDGEVLLGVAADIIRGCWCHSCYYYCQTGGMRLQLPAGDPVLCWPAQHKCTITDADVHRSSHLYCKLLKE